MYETLILLKPFSNFSLDDLLGLVVNAIRVGSAHVERRGDVVHVSDGEAWLDIEWDEAPHVARESDDIAKMLGIASHGCQRRFEMTGDDANLTLFEDYMRINNLLRDTGKFVIFDPQECELLFPEKS